MTNLSKITEKIIKFREERDWEQFHKPKDMAISLVLEAAEVLEHFQWKSNEEIDEYIKNSKNKIGEELADVLNWVILMSHDLDINILEALDDKIKKNKEKYPVEKAKGRYTKYNKL